MKHTHTHTHTHTLKSTVKLLFSSVLERWKHCKHCECCFSGFCQYCPTVRNYFYWLPFNRRWKRSKVTHMWGSIFVLGAVPVARYDQEDVLRRYLQTNRKLNFTVVCGLLCLIMSEITSWGTGGDQGFRNMIRSQHGDIWKTLTLSS